MEKNFEGWRGKNIQLILGRDLFIKGFDRTTNWIKQKPIKIRNY